MKERISILIVCCIGPFRNVAGHVVQAVIVREISIGANRVETTIFWIVATAGFEVGQQTPLSIADIRSTPRIHSPVPTTASGVLPLVLKRQTVVFGVLTVFAIGSGFVPQHGTPVAEGIGGMPIDPNYGIIIKSRVPEIVTGIRLIVRVSKIAHPYQRIRIYIYFFLLDEFISWRTTPIIGGFLPIVPAVLVFQVAYIDFLFAGKPIITLIVHFFQDSFRVLPIDFLVPVDAAFIGIVFVTFKKVLQDVVGDRILYPVNKLAVFVVGNFSVIHKKSLDRDLFGALNKGVADVLITGANQ